MEDEDSVATVPVEMVLGRPLAWITLGRFEEMLPLALGVDTTLATKNRLLPLLRLGVGHCKSAGGSIFLVRGGRGKRFTCRDRMDDPGAMV